MADHKATPEQWADAGAFAYDTRACLLELRDRIEALEAAQQPTIKESLTVAPAGSLVERVSCAIDGRINPDQWLHIDAARAAIREVAAWFEDENTDIGMGTAGNIAERLRDEAER